MIIPQETKVDNSQMMQLRAEVIAIGDEITSGINLDTNTQWISQRLGELGIQVAFHTTVGDDLNDNIDVFRIAAGRADVVVTTGGLGPTADDLTRQAIARMADVELVMHQSVLDHIKQMYKVRRREMPGNNEVQAWFPSGSSIINNPEGTAPGIDFSSQESVVQYRIFALPGVPVEMKQMWNETVEPELRAMVGNDLVIHHHTIHCFGAGESHIETMLPGLVERGRDPQVGITASSATISLRISTQGPTRAQCLEKMQPTIETIRVCLGDLVYGENGVGLHQVVVGLLQAQNKTVAILDAGLNGALASQMTGNIDSVDVLNGSRIINGTVSDLAVAAADFASSKGTEFGLAIGPIDRDPDTVNAGESFYDVVITEGKQTHQRSFRFGGHSGIREERATKEVLNYFRLLLLKSR